MAHRAHARTPLKDLFSKQHEKGGIKGRRERIADHKENGERRHRHDGQIIAGTE